MSSVPGSPQKTANKSAAPPQRTADKKNGEQARLSPVTTFYTSSEVRNDLMF